MQSASKILLTQHNMMLPLVTAVPSFFAEWASCLDGWGGDSEHGPPIYLGLSMLADHLIFALEHGETTRLSAAFAVVEQWFVDGDDYVKNAAAVGLFEDLFEADRYTSASVEEMQVWLMPVSRVWWYSIND